MISKKKFRYKPLYKKFVGLKKILQNTRKVLKFKKRKWQFLISQNNRLSKKRKNNSYYKFYDQNIYITQKFNSFFSNYYKQNLLMKKSFNLFCGNLGRKYLKRIFVRSQSQSNQIQNKINKINFFQERIENRLDMILFKSHFSLTLRNANQLISHGHVYVNKQKVRDGSFQLNINDVITFSKKSHKLLEYYLLNSNVWPLPPKYLQISYKIFQIKVVDKSLLINKSDNYLLNLRFNDIINFYK